ncbi:MAG: carboxypeptidase-like regulatory domain-containing protein [Terriglobia bacterium]
MPARSPLAMMALCAVAAVLLPLCALGKQKPMPVKSISGAVLNTSNAGVPGASVMLTDIETHHTDAIYSGAKGKYSFSGLNPNDDYQIRAKYKQLESNVRNASSLDSRNQIVINLVLSEPITASSSDRQ